MEALMQNGIMVVPGQQGDIDVVTQAFLDGTLMMSNIPNCDHHGHGEEHSCGCSGGCH